MCDDLEEGNVALPVGLELRYVVRNLVRKPQFAGLDKLSERGGDYHLGLGEHEPEGLVVG